MESLEVDRIRVHDRGVRDGIILEMIDELAGALGRRGGRHCPLATAIEFADRCGVNIRARSTSPSSPPASTTSPPISAIPNHSATARSSKPPRSSATWAW